MTSAVDLDLPILNPSILSAFPELRSGLSTRLGGISPQPLGMNLSFNVGDAESNVLENRKRFLHRLGVNPELLATAAQCHSATVIRVEKPGRYLACDALMTNQPNVFLAISVADCVPVLLFDPVHRAVAAVHAGWRGTSMKIVLNTLEGLKSAFQTNPADVYASIGPAAGVCCYEVGEEVASQFAATAVERRNGKVYLDVKTENKRQLVQAGVRKERIELNDSCTIHNPELYHSYRRDKEKSGRMMGVIGFLALKAV